MPLLTNFIEHLSDKAIFAINDPRQVMKQHALSPTEVLNLCGGIPLPDIGDILVKISSQYQGALSVEIKTDQYELIRLMDFDIGRLDNQIMVVASSARGQGIGTNLFLNQVQAAQRWRFKKLRTIARAPSTYEDGDVNWQGHYFWANLGFENIEHAEFKEWALARHRHESTLSELVQSEEGRQLWKDDGFTWIGEFVLANAHPCFKYLRRHLERKGINVNWEKM